MATWSVRKRETREAVKGSRTVTIGRSVVVFAIWVILEEVGDVGIGNTANSY